MEHKSDAWEQYVYYSITQNNVYYRILPIRLTINQHICGGFNFSEIVFE